jgi:hypothetical protein
MFSPPRFARPKRRLLAFVILFDVFLTSAYAKPPSVIYAGGDGSSFEKAIVVKAPNEVTGVAAEYAYLAKRYPGYRRNAQHLFHRKGKSFDVLDVTTREKKKRVFYFDITPFYGKWGR